MKSLVQSASRRKQLRDARELEQVEASQQIFELKWKQNLTPKIKVLRDPR